MKNQEVARIFFGMADYLELRGVDFKPSAYRRAARNIEGMSQDVEDLWREDRVGEIPGIGKNLAAKIAEYLETGQVQAYEKLKAEVPEGLVEIMRIQGVGPKTTKLLYENLGITTVEELKEAAASGRIYGVKGLGPKKAENILRGIELREAYKQRRRLGRALPMAESLVAYLQAHAPIDNIAIGGSLRRMRETIGDIDILVASTEPAEVMLAFVGMPEVKEVLLQGNTKSSVILTDGMQADLRVLDADSYGAGLLYFTGSKDHNIRLRSLAIAQGMKLSEYGVFRGEERVAGATEEEVYRALGLPYIEPELREAQGEIEAAQRGDLPRLITGADLKGDLHVHTNWSDGHDTLEAMVEAARAKGYEYVGISDHSQSLYIAGGLKEEQVREEGARIEALQEAMDDIHILHGAEVDILEEGQLDYPEDILEELDYAIGSIHSRFTQSEEEMTARVIAAMENEYLTILAHPTARQINEREPIALDLLRVFEAAVATGTALELNAGISRLDLNGAHAKAAKEAGVLLIINTDAHATVGLNQMKYGVGQARRGWLEAGDVVNTLPYEDFRAWLAREGRP
ncbi:MAG: DNA polymerase/3'-5' exonuclease PolX [Thermoplasmata archaeon]